MKTKNRIRICPLIVVGLLLILTNSCCKNTDDNNNSTSITDKDGNVYTSVTIGTQVWMVENLKTTKYNDGSAIPYAPTAAAWVELTTTPGYCWYNYDVANKTPYGALYNWFAVNTGKLCPTGWHVPTNTEWGILETFLGGWEVAGGKLKETGTIHWWSPNTGATNETGFTGLPGGMGGYDGRFDGIGDNCLWWSSIEFVYDSNAAYIQSVDSNSSGTVISSTDKRNGLSVRCLKD